MEDIVDISALDAWIKAEHLDDAWNKLCNRIKEEAEKGYFFCYFNEQLEKVSFREYGENVKTKLEELGYRVAHKREKDFDDWLFFKIYKKTYHNVFVISWKHIK